MDISLLSADYTIRQLTPADVDTVYHLCAENTLFMSTIRPLPHGKTL